MLEHAVDVRREIVIDADTDAVWGIVADAARQAEWFPGMVLPSMDGEVRTVATTVGGFLLEEILDVDHDARRSGYRITGAMHLEHHRGRITVLDDPDGARVVYGQEMEPESPAYVLDATIGGALDRIRDLVLDGRTSRRGRRAIWRSRCLSDLGVQGRNQPDQDLACAGTHPEGILDSHGQQVPVAGVHQVVHRWSDPGAVDRVAEAGDDRHSGRRHVQGRHREVRAVAA